MSSNVGFGDLYTRIVEYVLESLLAYAIYGFNWIGLELSWVKVEFRSIWVWLICFRVSIGCDLVRFISNFSLHRVNKISSQFGLFRSFRVSVCIRSIRFRVTSDSV